MSAFFIGTVDERNVHVNGEVARFAASFGAHAFVQIGPRWVTQASRVDINTNWYADLSAAVDEISAVYPDLVIVALETDSGATGKVPVHLADFKHPEHALYLLGPTNGTLQDETLSQAAHIVKVEAERVLPPALVAGIVMHDRLVQ